MNTKWINANKIEIPLVVGVSAEERAALSRLMETACRLYGGCTLTPPGFGMWMSPTVAVLDRVCMLHIIEHVTSDDRMRETEDAFLAAVNEYREALKQDCIYVCFSGHTDGTPYSGYKVVGKPEAAA